jgi:hypothetical protein
MAVENIVTDLVASIWNSFLLLLPNLIGAVLILILGLIAGKVLGGIAKGVLIHTGLDNWISKEKHIPIDLATVIAGLTSWVVYLLAIQEATNILNILTLQMFVAEALGFIFGVIRATAIVVVGYSLAMYLKDAIKSSRNIYSDMLGKTMFVVISYLSIALALPSIGIDATVVNNLLLVIVASFGLGAAIAIGLGMKDSVAQVGKKYLTKGKRRR